MAGAVFLMGLAALFTERAYRADAAGVLVPAPAIASIGRLLVGALILFVVALARP